MKSKEQLSYEKELEDYKFKLQMWYAKWNEANSCPLQWSDGLGNPDSLKCGLSGKTCTRCKMYNFSEPKPCAPKFKYFIKPIPKYCEDCIYKKECKDIQPDIEWCGKKAEQ